MENEVIDENKLLQFHMSKHDNKSSDDIVMERAHGLQTVSVSQVVQDDSVKTFNYNDLIDDYQLIVNIYG